MAPIFSIKVVTEDATDVFQFPPGFCRSVVGLHRKMLSWEKVKLKLVLESTSLREKVPRIQMIVNGIALCWCRQSPSAEADAQTGIRAYHEWQQQRFKPVNQRQQALMHPLHTKKKFKSNVILLALSCPVCERLDLELIYQSAMSSCFLFQKEGKTPTCTTFHYKKSWSQESSKNCIILPLQKYIEKKEIAGLHINELQV